MKILITGASSGIGAELSRQYATKENELILLARRDDKLFELRSELFESAKSVEVIVADLKDTKELQKKIAKLSEVDMVILNAGISIGHSQEITPIDEFKNIFDINLFANHAILEVLLPMFVKQKSAKIVFISSLASLVSMPSSTAYSASKRALNAYCESISYNYKKDNIKVINILPGFIKTELTDKNDFHMPFLLDTYEGVKRIKKAIDTEKKFYAFPLRFYLIIKIFNTLPYFLREMIVNFIYK
jgi:short-subunit dehydrogenase